MFGACVVIASQLWYIGSGDFVERTAFPISSILKIDDEAGGVYIKYGNGISATYLYVSSTETYVTFDDFMKVLSECPEINE